MSKGLMTAVAAIAAVVLVGCGGSSSNSRNSSSPSAFTSAFRAQSQSFTALGNDLQTAIATASTTSSSKIASEFRSLASRTTQAAAALRALKPPAKYQADVLQLAAGFDTVAADMTAVSAASKKHDRTAARTVAAKLVTDSDTIRAADLKLTHELGLPTTGG